MPLVLLGLGANLGDAQGNLRQAAQLLSELDPNLKASQIYRSAPFEGLAQDSYLNGVIELSTDLGPRALLGEILKIEAALGRVRDGIKWQSRAIDIDILAYGAEVIDQEGLQIPHYDLVRRDFFLIPISEVAPSFIHPVSQKGIQQLIAELPPHLNTQLSPLCPLIP